MMKILFERTGGFMGRKISLHLNLDDLPSDQAGALKHLLDEVDFLNLEEDKSASLYARDAFHYLVRVETEKIQHSVHVTDLSMPAALRPLIEELSRLARTKNNQ